MPIELRSRTVKKPAPGDCEVVPMSTKKEINRRPRTEVQTTKQAKKATKSEGTRKPYVEEIILEEDEAETENIRKHYKQIHEILTVPLKPPGHDQWNANLQSIKEKYMCRIANMKKAEAHGSILCKTPLAKKVLGNSIRAAQDILSKSPDEIIDVFESSVTEVASVSSASTQDSKSGRRGARKPRVKKKVSIPAYQRSPWGRVTRATARRLAGSNTSSASGQSVNNASSKNKAPPKKQNGKKAKDLAKDAVGSERDCCRQKDTNSQRDRKRKLTTECTGVNRIDAIPEFFDFEDSKSLSNAMKKRRMEKCGQIRGAGRSVVTNSDTSSASSKTPAEELPKSLDTKLKVNPVVRLSMTKEAIEIYVRTNLLEDEENNSKSSVIVVENSKTSVTSAMESTPATPGALQEIIKSVESKGAVQVEATPIAGTIETPFFTPTVPSEIDNAESPNVFESSIVATPVEKTNNYTEISGTTSTSIRQVPLDHTFCKSSSSTRGNQMSNVNPADLNQTYVNRAAATSTSNATFSVPSQTPDTPKSALSNQTYVSCAKDIDPVAVNALNSTFAINAVTGATTQNVTCLVNAPEPVHRPPSVLATTFTVGKKFPSISGAPGSAKKPSVTASPRKGMGSPLIPKGPKKIIAETRVGLRESASSVSTQDTIKSITSASTRGSGTSVSKKDGGKIGALGGRNMGAVLPTDRKKQEEPTKLHGQNGLQRLEEKLAEGARKKELYVQQKKDNQRKKNEEWVAKIEKKKAEDAKAEAKAKIDSRAEDLKKGYVHKIAAGFAKPLPPSAYNNGQKQPTKNPAVPHYLKNQGEMTSSCPDISGGSGKHCPGNQASTTLQKIYNSAGNLLVNVFGGKAANKVPMGPPAAQGKPISRTVVYDGDSSSGESDADDSFATADTTMHSAQNLSTYDITIYEDLNEDMAHRENKRIPDWAKNDAKLRYNLFLQQPDLMDRLNMPVFPQKNIGYKLFPSTARDGY